MRLALVSDVHGNLRALQAVVAAAEPFAVDGWVSAGDVVGYGAHPVECLDLLDALGARGVAGNHELIVLGRLTTERCTPMAREAADWTRRVLTDHVLERLAALPLVRELPGVTVAHGSPGDPQEYVRTGARADALLAALPRGGHLVLGHTHEPWVRVDGHDLLRRRPGRVALGSAALVNPGSVGQSRSADPAARFAVLDLAAGWVELLAVPYDLDAARLDLERAGLSRHSYARPTWRERLLSGVGLQRRAVVPA